MREQTLYQNSKLQKESNRQFLILFCQLLILQFFVLLISNSYITQTENRRENSNISRRKYKVTTLLVVGFIKFQGNKNNSEYEKFKQYQTKFFVTSPPPALPRVITKQYFHIKCTIILNNEKHLATQNAIGQKMGS